MTWLQDTASILFPPYGVYHAYDVIEDKTGSSPLQTLNLGMIALVLFGAYLVFKK